MVELLLPGTPLYLTRSDNPARKLPYSVFGTERDGDPICLDTQFANQVAAHLIDKDRVPGLEGARVLGREVTHGRHRFDLLVNHGGVERFAEVKSTTLYGNGAAAFPDAVTERGRLHLESLAQLSSPKSRPLVLFVVHTQSASRFVPDYHTDLAFARTFLDVRDRVDFLPLAISWAPDFTLASDPAALPIPWTYLEGEVADRGSYVILLHVGERQTLSIGRLGDRVAEPGWYLYVGSADRGLSARVARHLRLRKRRHWHIDHLRPAADRVVALPIRSSRHEECDVARTIGRLYPVAWDAFGSSDCDCPAHLFRAETNPLEDRAFHDLLHQFRFRTPIDESCRAGTSSART